jgi:peptidyl-dipeptidase Dcp
MITLMTAALIAVPAFAANAAFGPANPFFAPSVLPFQAPPFDKIKDSDYQAAIEAGMAQQRAEIDAIANDPAPRSSLSIRTLSSSTASYLRG